MAAFRRAVIALSMLLSLPMAPLAAQLYRWDLSVNGGWSNTNRALSGDRVRPLIFDDDIDDGLIDDDDLFDNGSLNLNNDWITGAQLGYWFSRSFGLRANVSYSQTSFDQGDFSLFNDVNVWGGTLDGMFRFLKPRQRWEGSEWLPYAALGLGANWINPSGDNFIIADADDFSFDIDGDGDIDLDDGQLTVQGKSGVPIICTLGVCTGPGSDGFPGLGSLLDEDSRTFFLREKSSFTGLVALGTDLRLAPSFALRLETGLRFWEAPIDEVETAENIPFVVREIDHVGETVTQFYITLGANLLMGLRPPPERVVAAPAPPPPKPAPPKPAPPATESITVCVVDPTIPQGIQSIHAKRYISSGDTTVQRNGTEMPLSSAVGSVPVASNADWFIRGAPLEIGRAPNRLSYLTVGGARTMDDSELKFIGTVQGLPVFISKQAVMPAFEVLQSNIDLSQVVAESNDVYKALDSVQTIYVPLQPVGCVFQALDKQIEVRKGK